jgi:magnesium chelatase subunit D
MPGAPPVRAPGAGPRSEIFQIAGTHEARVRPPGPVLAQSAIHGRWRLGKTQRRTPRAGLVTRYVPNASLAWAATLRAAALYQGDRGGPGTDDLMVLRAADLRTWPQRGTAGCLLLFLVDTSGSMASWQRMRQTKAAVLALLLQAAQRRDYVALLAFHHGGAEVVLPPRRGLRAARQALEVLPVGGLTPLAHGLAAGQRLIAAHQRRSARQSVWTIVLTDGRANVAKGAGDPWQEALREARNLAARATEILVVDTETGWPRFDRAAALARALGARCLPLEEVLGRPRPDPWRRAV